MHLLQGTCSRNAPLSKYQNKYKNTTIQKYRKQNKNAKLHATHCKVRDCMQYIFCKLYKYKIACSIFFENFTSTKLCAVSFFAKFRNIQLCAIFFCKLYKYRYKIVCNSLFAKFAKLYKKFCPAVNLDSWTLAQFTNAHPTE